MAEASKKPFYVAVESYKFARMYPLSQRDTRDILGKNNTKGNRSRTTSGNYESNNAAAFTNYNLDDKSLDVLVKDLPANVSIDLPAIDFTPAKLITLLITDLGVLTPAAVSDELIRLYQ